MNTRTVLAIVPPQGCEAILIEILQSKRYCLLVETPSRSQHSGTVGITDDEICNNPLFHTKLARQRSINVRISMIYLGLLYVYSLLRKQHVKCGPPADRFDCRISIKMDSQPCGGTIANKPTQCVYSQLGYININLPQLVS